jgi:plastocyanin domain-containing protein
MRAAFLCLALLLGCRETAKPPPTQAASGGPPVKEVAVTVKGFEPARIEVAAGQPVVLRFTRKVAETCADAVDVQGDPVRHMLPLDRPVDIRVTAPASGEVAFACPMKMYRGVVIVAGH